MATPTHDDIAKSLTGDLKTLLEIATDPNPDIPTRIKQMRRIGGLDQPTKA